jgi:hypothetical protein
MPTKRTTVAELPVSLTEAIPDAISAQIATIVSLTGEGTPEIRFGVSGPVVPARLALPVTRERIETAIVLQQQTVVVFENGDRARPLIVGFIESLDPQPAAHHADVSDGHRDAAPPEPPTPAAHVTSPDTSERAPFIEADVDGKRVRLTAQDEIVLQCGSASVTLRRNGRVVIRGTYVETHSEGTNRIKGGQVRIN